MRALVLLTLAAALAAALPATVQRHHHDHLSHRVVLEGFRSVEDLEAVVASADVRAVWRSSAILAAHSSSLPKLPEGVIVAHTFEMAEEEYEVIALDVCPNNTATTNGARVIYTQKDGSCIISSLVPYEDLDQALRRENILPSAQHRMLPQQHIKPPTFVANVAQKDDRIADILKLVDVASQTQHLKSLTHDFNTRLSSTPEVSAAAAWLKGRFEEVGLKSRLVTYSKTYGPLVEAILPGSGASDEIVIIGAHLDDRSKNINDPKVRAPGANDDGSGIAMLLESALVLKNAGVQFSRTIHFCAFTGEEQGLHGSTAYASELVKNGTKVAAMLQGDMLAVRQPNKQARMAIAVQYSTAWMEDWLRQIATMYVPDLSVEVTDSCCTDQMPFYTRGYPAIAVNEGGGYLIDPMYHNTGDVMERDDYSVEQISFITRVVVAAAVTSAEIA